MKIILFFINDRVVQLGLCWTTDSIYSIVLPLFKSTLVILRQRIEEVTTPVDLFTRLQERDEETLVAQKRTVLF